MTAISSTTTTSANPLEILQENLSKPEKWLYLVPTIATLAIGAFFIPNIAIGMAAGVGIFAAGSAIAVALGALGVVKKEETPSEYIKFLEKWPVIATLVGPVLEEGLFRGGMLPLIARSLVLIVPATAAAFLGTPLTIATTVAVVATAAIFGFVHLFNPHKNAHLQAIVTTLSGIAFGLIAVQFGLGAAIAAHILNNTIAITIAQLFGKDQPPATSQTTTATV